MGEILDHDIAVAFGKALREARVSLSLSQEELGFRAQIQRKHVSALELGTKLPSIATVFTLARALGLEPEVLVRLTQEQLNLRLLQEKSWLTLDET